MYEALDEHNVCCVRLI